jgi:hypothetical protein
MSITCWTFSPIIDGDGALIHSSASLPVKPLLTLNIGKANVVPSLTASRAGCDRERFFHEGTIAVNAKYIKGVHGGTSWNKTEGRG